MNHVLADNSIMTMQKHIAEALQSVYNEREVKQITSAMFLRYKNMDRSQMLLSQSERLSESELLLFHFAIKKLKNGEPLQYVLGSSYFFGLEFLVDSRVLIPRPETEELIQAIIDLNFNQAPIIVDVGTGSGCIAISLAKKISNAVVHAVDVSSGAIEVARLNAARNNVQIEFSELNILNNDLPIAGIDILVSNPPYVLESDKLEMHNNVLDHEPHLALFVPNNDPLLFYKRLKILALKHLKPNGILACEMHERMENELIELFADVPQSDLRFFKDMQQKTRFFIYRKNNLQ